MLTEKEARELLDKYFEGETSCSEEKQLRLFFTTTVQLPDDLFDYRPLFVYLDEESRTAVPHTVVRSNRHRILYYALSGVAASLLLLLGISTFNRYSRGESNSAFINGEQITDIKVVRQQARVAFAEVSFSKEELADEMMPDDIK